MYGVPPDLPIQPFVGRELNQICLGRFQIHLNCSGTGSIRVEGYWELRDSTGVLVDAARDHADRDSYRLHRIIDVPITRFSVDASGPTSQCLPSNRSSSRCSPRGPRATRVSCRKARCSTPRVVRLLNQEMGRQIQFHMLGRDCDAFFAAARRLALFVPVIRDSPTASIEPVDQPCSVGSDLMLWNKAIAPSVVRTHVPNSIRGPYHRFPYDALRWSSARPAT